MKDRAAREEALRRQLQRRLRAARERSDEVLGLVRDEALYERPVPERHRLVFYLGHLEAFDANLLLRDSLGRVPLRPDLDRLFAFGIDPLDGGLPQDRPVRLAAVEEVRRYGACLRDAVDGALETTPLLRPIHPNLEEGWAFGLAIEHRLMHAETLAYLIHQLPCASKGPGPLPPVPVRPAPPRRLVDDPRRTRDARARAREGTAPRLGQRVRGARGRAWTPSRSSVTTSRTPTSSRSSPPAATASARSGARTTGRGSSASGRRAPALLGAARAASGATAPCSARCRSARRGRST